MLVLLFDITFSLRFGGVFQGLADLLEVVGFEDAAFEDEFFGGSHEGVPAIAAGDD